MFLKPKIAFIDADDVAGLTGFTSGRAFMAARFRLETEEGFPLPMPTCRRPMIWREDVVTAWVSERGTPEADKLPAQMPGNVHLLELARSSRNAS